MEVLIPELVGKFKSRKFWDLEEDILIIDILKKDEGDDEWSEIGMKTVHLFDRESDKLSTRMRDVYNACTGKKNPLGETRYNELKEYLGVK